MVRSGHDLIGQVHSSKIVPVFYPQKRSARQNLDLATLVRPIDWGDAKQLIVHEGFYLFGGKGTGSEPASTLLIIQVDRDEGQERAAFNVIQPELAGKPPGARYMHGMDFIPELGVVCIFGGRNDQQPKRPILDDLWMLKLDTLEYMQVQVGGDHSPMPRCNFTSYVNGKQLVIMGGQTEGFKPCKTIEFIELDQDEIDRSNPVLKNLSKNIRAHFKK